MEVGAVKQAFNNELILLKKKLNQAKIQTIHKLTRKAKTLTDRKAPEQLKEKLKRKAASAVNEVLIIKKIKAKDIAKFMITHTGQLKDYMNKPTVDQDKACARLLLHKAMQEKYKFIRGRFADVPIKDLFMSREERRKIKKEAREKQKNKKEKGNNKVVNSEGDWNVEDVTLIDNKEPSHDVNVSSDDDNEHSEIEHKSTDISDAEQNSKDSVKESDTESDHEAHSRDNTDEIAVIDTFVRLKPDEVKSKLLIDSIKAVQVQKDRSSKCQILKKNEKRKPEKKQKDSNKNKNFNEKILQRKFKRDIEEAPVLENKVVDPFFITSTGENYMSVAEPRQPDEIKEVHKQGNRKLRRAVMFGHVPNIKPRQNNYRDNNTFNRQNNFDKGFRDKHDRFGNNGRTNFDDTNSNFNDKMSNYNGKRNFNDKNDQIEPQQEKLHPSWEAKKRQSGILPFQGKKIVFDES